MEKGKERNEKEEEGLWRGGWTQDPINCDGGQKTEEWMCWCDLSPLLLSSLLTWTGYDSMTGCLQTVHVRAKTNPDTRGSPTFSLHHCSTVAASTGANMWTFQTLFLLQLSQAAGIGLAVRCSEEFNVTDHFSSAV